MSNYGLDDWCLISGRVRFLFTSVMSTQDMWFPSSSPVDSQVHSLRITLGKCKTDHSLPSNAEVKDAWSFISTSLIHIYDMVLRYKVNLTPFSTSYLMCQFQEHL
jgi:hypothetical protein